ncbi:hypothetical protein D3C72_197400 [compost metagenome]
MSKSLSQHSPGFSLLEIMLAALVLLMGLMAVTQLSKGLLSNLSPSQAQGPNQHPAIIENLLRDQIEQARSASTHAAVANVADLVTPHGTYRTSVALAALPVVAPQNVGVTMNRRRYVATVQYQAVGAAAPGVIAGQVVFDKVTGRAGRSGL